MKWIRHGDVILEKVDSIKGTQKKVNESILAEGEVTGHFHRLKGNLLVSEFEGSTYIQLDQPAILSHEEHDTLEIPEGMYRVVMQREVDLLGQVRKVID
jgi:hypothetical protein